MYENIKDIPNLTEWNKSWKAVDDSAIMLASKLFDFHYQDMDIETNGKYIIVFYGRNSHPANDKKYTNCFREVYYWDNKFDKPELIKKCTYIQSGFSYARRTAYEHWKNNLVESIKKSKKDKQKRKKFLSTFTLSVNKGSLSLLNK